MKKALSERGESGAGIPTENMTLYHLVGRDTANSDHPNRQTFSLQFARLSPYAVAEILDLSEPQQIRFMRAYDIAKEVLRDLEIFPKPGDKDQERLAMEIDEFERGYPRLTLSIMMDVVAACLKVAESPKGSSRSKEKEAEPAVEFAPFDARLKSSRGLDSLRTRIYSGPRPDQPVSWRALLGRLARLNRLKVFDVTDDGASPVIYKNLLTPGAFSVVDLSDSGASGLNNIVIADLLHGIQAEQDEKYQTYEAARRHGEPTTAPSRTLVIIEEAHEFLSAERIEKMKILFEQVARIAKRGRKRWLGLVFVTQLPQHLPRQIFGLVNSYVLHKITDPQVVSTLRHTVSGIDDGLWKRVPALAPGQAIVSFPHMERPLLVSIDPAPCELRMVD
jgi:predicted house-cleaning noncanonical NTP pyrophosphatase (MazG superfamily)